jgi:hypothetical protein
MGVRDQWRNARAWHLARGIAVSFESHEVESFGVEFATQRTHYMAWRVGDDDEGFRTADSMVLWRWEPVARGETPNWMGPPLTAWADGESTEWRFPGGESDGW